MSQTLANRMTTVPQQSFLNCVSLSIREEDLNTSELDGLHGGNPIGRLLQELPKVYRAAQQAINRGMPPVVYAALEEAEQIVDAAIDTCDSIIDEVSDAIVDGIADFENGVKNGWVPGSGYGG